MVLAQVATGAESDEITAVPVSLQMPKPRGTIVTADALNRQRSIARQIVDEGGDEGLAWGAIGERCTATSKDTSTIRKAR